MPISAEDLRELAALNLSGEAMAAVLRVVANSIGGDDERRRKDRERKNNFPRMRQAEWVALSAFIFARDREICAYCSTTEEPFHIDHIVPRLRGGTDDPDNLTVACAHCNCSKSDRLLSEWKRRP